jgi:hypothetical protein
MEYLILFMTIVIVLWLLNKLKQGPPASTPRADSPIQARPVLKRPAGLGRGLDVLIPTNDGVAFSRDKSWPIPDNEQADLPPAPPAWTEDELDSYSGGPRENEVSHLSIEWLTVSDEDVRQATQEALTVMMKAGLFPRHQDWQALSQEIIARCDAQTSPYPSNLSTLGWSYWHDFVHLPNENRHPWLDPLMLLGFGPEAGYALHNAFHKGFTEAAFTDFGEACRQLSAGSLQVETILWQQVDEQTYQLRVDEQVATYDITRQALWKVPLQFVRMLNAKLPEQDRRFDVFTLLPLFGETLVFYLSREEKEILESKRGWQFFDWNNLEEGAP